MKITFVDEADIVVESGSGGEGSIHFHRARFLPKGGPDGGDGGRGGDVVLTVRENLSDLSMYLHKTFFKARHGVPGGPNRRHGKDGKPLSLSVPVGTQAYKSETEELLCDLDTLGATFVVARGGKGGKGNVHFKNSVRQAPKIAQKGLPGQRVALHLVYKMMTDVGLIGLPNAGKSLLLSRITSARPKVAAYPSTTRVPQLGVHLTEDSESLTFAEIPALGISLEKRFLKHAERARLLLFLLDLSESREESELVEKLETILTDVKAYGHGLSLKPTLLALNKVDIAGGKDTVKTLVPILEGKTGIQTFAISARTGEGLEALLKVIASSCKLERV